MVVDGVVLMREREMLTIDTERVAAEATCAGVHKSRLRSTSATSHQTDTAGVRIMRNVMAAIVGIATAILTVMAVPVDWVTSYFHPPEGLDTTNDSEAFSLPTWPKLPLPAMLCCARVLSHRHVRRRFRRLPDKPRRINPMLFALLCIVAYRHARSDGVTNLLMIQASRCGSRPAALIGIVVMAWLAAFRGQQGPLRDDRHPNDSPSRT